MSWADKVADGKGPNATYEVAVNWRIWGNMPDGKFNMVGLDLNPFCKQHGLDDSSCKFYPVGVTLKAFNTDLRHLDERFVVLAAGPKALPVFGMIRLVRKNGEIGIFKGDWGHLAITVPPDEPIHVWNVAD